MNKMLKIDSSGNLQFSIYDEKEKDLFFVNVSHPHSFFLYAQKHKKLQNFSIDVGVMNLSTDEEITCLTISAQNFKCLPSFYKTFKFLHIVIKLENFHV